MLRSIEMYILLFFTFAFAGWFMESVGGILKVKKFVNRGFLIGPYCPVYGVGVVLVTLLLKNYTNDISALFILSIVICGTLEYFTSYAMEKLFNARWWDYHNRKFNINGRICLETLLPFGIAATVILKYINPFLFDCFSKLPELWLNIISGTLCAIYIIDSIVSFKIILSFRGATYSEKDNTEEIGAKVKDKTGEVLEDVFMKAESDVRLFGRKLKLGELRLHKKVRYTRKKLSETILETPKQLAYRISKSRNNVISKISEGKEKVTSQVKLKRAEFELKQKETKEILNKGIKKRKEEIGNLQRISKERIDNTISNVKASSDEFTKQVIARFRKNSFLKNRLMDAFPMLEVKKKDKNKKK